MPTRATDGRRAAVLGSPIALPLPGAAPRRVRARPGSTLVVRQLRRRRGRPARLPGRARAGGAGLSLTMPLKRAVIPLLDEISDTTASVDAVNTLVLTEDGRRLGDNTDIPGMVAALREHGIEQVDSAAVLGAGATASSALAALARNLHRGGRRLRSAARARAAEMRQWGERLDVEVRTADWADAGRGAARPAGDRHARPAGTTDALAGAVPERPATLFDVLTRPLAHSSWRPAGPCVRRCRGQRPRPAGPPGRAPVRADDRARPGARWTPCGNAGEKARGPLTHRARPSCWTGGRFARLRTWGGSAVACRGRAPGWRRPPWRVDARTRAVPGASTEEHPLSRLGCWLTGGESHGPALSRRWRVLPAGVRSPRRWWRITWRGGGSAMAAVRA